MGRMYLSQQKNGTWKITIVIGRYVERFECGEEDMMKMANERYNEIAQSIELAKKL